MSKKISWTTRNVPEVGVRSSPFAETSLLSQISSKISAAVKSLKDSYERRTCLEQKRAFEKTGRAGLFLLGSAAMWKAARQEGALWPNFKNAFFSELNNIVERPCIESFRTYDLPFDSLTHGSLEYLGLAQAVDPLKQGLWDHQVQEPAKPFFFPLAGRKGSILFKAFIEERLKYPRYFRHHDRAFKAALRAEEKSMERELKKLRYYGRKEGVDPKKMEREEKTIRRLYYRELACRPEGRERILREWKSSIRSLYQGIQSALPDLASGFRATSLIQGLRAFL